jgi:hypothetical protein
VSVKFAGGISPQDAVYRRQPEDDGGLNKRIADLAERRSELRPAALKIPFQTTKAMLYYVDDEVVKFMEAQDKSGLSLTGEQVAEVQRRLAEDNPRVMTLAEFSDQLAMRSGIRADSRESLPFASTTTMR